MWKREISFGHVQRVFSSLDEFIVKETKVSLEVKTLQVEESGDDEEFEQVWDDDELSFISRKVKHLWSTRNKQISNNKYKQSRDTRDKKGTNKKFISYECKELRHFKNECPMLEKWDPRKVDSFERWNIMTTWDESY